jgi:hypothetical protein
VATVFAMVSSRTCLPLALVSAGMSEPEAVKLDLSVERYLSNQVCGLLFNPVMETLGVPVLQVR